MDLGDVDRTLYISGVFTLNKATIMLRDLCIKTQTTAPILHSDNNHGYLFRNPMYRDFYGKQRPTYDEDTT